MVQKSGGLRNNENRIEKGRFNVPRGRVVLWSLVLVAACRLEAQAADDVEALFEREKQHLKTGNYDQAVQILSEALDSVDPDGRNARVVRLTRAQAYFGKGDLKGLTKTWTKSGVRGS